MMTKHGLISRKVRKEYELNFLISYEKEYRWNFVISGYFSKVFLDFQGLTICSSFPKPGDQFLCVKLSRTPKKIAKSRKSTHESFYQQIILFFTQIPSDIFYIPYSL